VGIVVSTSPNAPEDFWFILLRMVADLAAIAGALPRLKCSLVLTCCLI
jgi:hypothetical protein